MWIFDTLRDLLQKSTTKVIDTTAKVWSYIEWKSAGLIEKVPGGHTFKEKASEYTEKTVHRIGQESEEMVGEAKHFIEEHKKKHPTTTKPDSIVTPSTVKATPPKKKKK